MGASGERSRPALGNTKDTKVILGPLPEQVHRRHLQIHKQQLQGCATPSRAFFECVRPEEQRSDLSQNLRYNRIQRLGWTDARTGLRPTTPSLDQQDRELNSGQSWSTVMENRRSLSPATL